MWTLVPWTPGNCLALVLLLYWGVGRWPFQSQIISQEEFWTLTGTVYVSFSLWCVGGEVETVSAGTEFVVLGVLEDRATYWLSFLDWVCTSGVEEIDVAQSCRNFKIKLGEFRNLHLRCKMGRILTKPCFRIKHPWIFRWQMVNGVNQVYENLVKLCISAHHIDAYQILNRVNACV